MALRRLRRTLRAEELDGGGGRSSDALLVELLEDPARAATLPAVVRRGPAASSRVRWPPAVPRRPSRGRARRPCCGRCGRRPASPSGGGPPRSTRPRGRARRP
ncbi:hypothetical protein BJF88_12545 [Cellulosimicrobium sp. CUA-896]|nr:hypothetical protein BJF88_12545 [Cellulosimicrobium sp. CUA-896]